MATDTRLSEGQINQEIAEEADELKRLRAAHNFLLAASMGLQRIETGGVTHHIGGAAHAIIEHQQADFANASINVQNAIKELELSVHDEQALVESAGRIPKEGRTAIETAAVNYANLHARKISPVVSALQIIKNDLTDFAQKSYDNEQKQIDFLRERAKELLKGLNRPRQQVFGIYKEVLVIFKALERFAPKEKVKSGWAFWRR